MKRLLAVCSLSCSLVLSCAQDDDPVQETVPVVNRHQDAQTMFIKAGGVKHAYRTLNESEGTPLIMLSPLQGAMDDWDPTITNGLADKHKVIIFDYAGVGSSSGTTPSSIAELAQDAVSVIRALQYDKVDILGFSMGGFVAQQIALTEPELIRRIVLTGTGPQGAEGLANLPNVLAETQGLSPEEQSLQLGFTDSKASRSAGKAYLKRLQERTVDRDPPVSAESGAAEFAAVLDWAQPHPDALEQLAAVTQPVLIVSGRHDRLVPFVNGFNLVQALPNASLIVLPDAGHAAFVQHGDRFIAEVNRFLE
jgi:pimeloyl-ACP methyl ester carboxylesterase